MTDGSTSADLSPLQQAFLALERAEARSDQLERAAREPIAIVGIGCRLPGAPDPEALWQLLRRGGDAIREVPVDRWDLDELYDPDPTVPGKMSTRHGGFLDNIDGFDPDVFGIAPREAQGMDPQQRLLLEVGWETLERAGVAPMSLQGSRTGVFVGVTTGDYAQLTLNQQGVDGLDAYYASGVSHSIASGRLSYVLGLEGPAMTLDTACSSSLTAIHLAVQSLRLGESDLALAGGVNVIVSPETSITLSKYNMMAPDGRCKFGADTADGFVRAEGCAMVALKRLSDAQADSDRILAVIRGSAIGQDGASSGLTAPNGPSQERVIRDALANGSTDPAAVSYVEAHGTGTALGDPIEIRALGTVFGPSHTDRDPLVVGSVKTNLGHLEASAGVTGLLKLALMIQHREIPASLHFTAPNPHIPWATLPIEIPTAHDQWRADDGLVAGLSSFGFSGTNVHLVVAEPPSALSPQASPDTKSTEHAVARPARIVPVSGRSQAAVHESATNLAAVLADRDAPSLDAVAHTATVGRTHFDHRAAVVAMDRSEASELLTAVPTGETSDRVHLGHRSRNEQVKVGFLYTGQGSQHFGMGRDLYRLEPVFRAAIDRCAVALDPHLDHPLLHLMGIGADLSADPDLDSGLIDQTAFTQPVTVAIEFALTELWSSWGVTPSAVLGHSVGEYAAAVTAGVMSIEDCLGLIATRGRLMQELPDGGGMTAVFAAPDEVIEAVAPYGDRVAVAAFNGPTHVVLSGDLTALDELSTRFDSAGIRTRPLNVSHAFHSSRMDPMLDRFEAAVRSVEMTVPHLRLISNVTGGLAGDAITQSDYWRRHARQPVLFHAGMQELAAAGCDVFIEVGPQPTLIGLGQQVLDDKRPVWLPSVRRGRDEAIQIYGSLADAFCHGVEVDWNGLEAPHQRPETVELPTYPFQRQRFWIRPGGGNRARFGGGVGHPLLGTRIASPLKTAQFTNELTVDGPDFLRDHRVHGVTILPGTGFIEMALAAGAEVLGTACSIDSIDLIAALVVDVEPSTVNTVVTPTDAGAGFEISSSTDGGMTWVLHARGGLVASHRADQPSDPANLAAIRNGSYGTTVGATEHRARLTDAGLSFGPSLGGVQQLSTSDSEACAEIDLVADPGPYRFHPAVLDACLQAMAWLVGDTEDVFLPFAIERIEVHAPPVDAVVAHARVGDRTNPDLVSGDVDVYDANGSLLASLQGVHFRRIDVAALRASRAIDLAGSLYTVDWEERPLPRTAAPTIANLPSPMELLDDSESRIEDLAGQHDLGRYQVLNDEIEALSTDYALHALHRMVERSSEQRAAAQPGSGPTFASTELGVIDSHLRLIRRLIDGLTNDGRLTRDGDRYAFVDDEPDLATIGERLNVLEQDHPAARGQIALVRRCGEHLADALTGRQDPLELLFPGGSADDAEHMYRQSPFAHFYNSLAAEAVNAATVEATAERPLRILEIGAGTGGTTAHVLDRVDRDRVSYTFTDVSPIFVERAKEEFGAIGCMNFAALDIEADVESQGFTTHDYDMVIATNVLHATADLRQTFARVRSLLAPGGVLVVMEMTKPERFIDISFGLTPGWWKFHDHDLRPDYLLLDQDRWLDFLRGEGFETPCASPTITAIGGADLTVQSLLIATNPTGEFGADAATSGPEIRELDDTSWLVLADGGSVGTSLADQLTERGASVVLAGSGPGHDLTVDRADSDQLQRLVTDHELAPWTGVVHLWSLDPSDADGLTDQRSRTGSALAVTQAMLDGGGSPRLWLVTRGAQGVSGSVPDPGQAPIWGFGKVVDLEHPELKAVCVDLDPAASSSPAADLVPELLARGEAMVAYRRGNRFVARLNPLPEAAEPAGFEPTALRLELADDGTLDGMRLEPADRLPPGPGQVEVRVHASGLNFRDVMNALAMRDDQVPAGGECAGVVTAIGDGVDEFSVGDAVVAIATGCFATFVNTPADLVAAKPPSLTFAQAATIPLAFLTAHYALHDLADLSAGETVLVHAAAGGVGLAAVQLAKRAGAVPLGTAGSEMKRRYLETLGVTPAMNSRNTDFVAAVSQATGGRGVDVALNSLVGEFIPATLESLGNSGRFVELGKREILSADRLAAEHPSISYHTVPLADDLEHRPELVGPTLRKIVSAIAAGELQPLPVQTFPLTEASEAFRYMAQARHIGKIVLVDETVAAGSTTPPLARSDGTTLITGGLAGLGLAVAEWLVERGAVHLALLGRSAPNEEARAAIERMEKQGATVLVLEADVAERSQLRAALATIDADLPPLRAVIHSAGLLDDGAILRQDWKRFSKVMAPKVTGASLLDELTRDHALDHFVLFSSAASMFGSGGQANHAAANTYLDALAANRRAHGRPGLSINWGAWSEIGAAVATGAATRNEELGLHTISVQDGLAALEALTGQGRPQVGVVPIDWLIYLRQFDQTGPPPYLSGAGMGARTATRSEDLVAASGPVIDLEELASSTSEQRDRLLVDFVSTQVARVLGAADPATLDPVEPLHDMGLDSLMAVELRNLLGSGLGLDDALPAVLVFNYPTIEALSGFLGDDILGLESAEPSASDATNEADAGPGQSVEDLLAAVEEMSDDELDGLFADNNENDES